MIEEQPKLNPKQQKFCKLYATDREFFGNGVESYVEVYEPDKSKPNWYKSACSSASRLLRHVKVCEYINGLLESSGFNNEFVDKATLFLITQHSDFKTKLGAIKEYNALKQRIIKKLDLTSGGKSFGDLLQQISGTKQGLAQPNVIEDALQATAKKQLEQPQKSVLD